MPRDNGPSYVLDTSALIQILTPQRSQLHRRAVDNFLRLRGAGFKFYVPAIAYHEAMRGAELASLKYGDKKELNALRNLVKLGGVRLLDLSNVVLRRADKLWAELVHSGKTVDNAKLSGDVVIAAEVRTLRRAEAGKVVLTENSKHFDAMGVRNERLSEA